MCRVVSLPEQIQHKAFLVVLLGCGDTHTPVDRYSRLIMNARMTVVMLEKNNKERLMALLVMSCSSLSDLVVLSFLNLTMHS